MVSTPAPIKNGHLNSDHLGSRIHVGHGSWLVQGELHAVRHGGTERSEGIPRVTVVIKVNAAGYDQFIALELHTEGEDVSITVLDTEAEWKG